MNESLDLRNRILKMRESNNLVLDQVNSETKNIKSNIDVIGQDINHNPYKEKENLIDSTDKTNTGIQKENRKHFKENEKIVDTNLFTNKSANPNIKYEKNKETLNTLANDNEAQFRIIANKFNEAVEVILELSEKVKKLEEIVNNFQDKSNEDKNKYFFFNIKTFVYIIITTLLIVAFSFFPIDMSLIKLIIADVISSI